MFNTLRKLGVAAVLVAGLAASAASAATFVYPFVETLKAGGASNAHFVTRTNLAAAPYDVYAYAGFSVDGAGTATASQPMFLARGNIGWGIKNPSLNSQFEDGRMGGGETMLFDFRNREVSLTSVSFTTPGPSSNSTLQRFDIYVKALGTQTYTKVVNGAVANPSGTPVTGASFDLTGMGVTGSAFAIVSLDSDPTVKRGFRLSSFAGTVAVPTPGSAVALGGGLLLGGLVLHRRKNKSKT